MTDIKITTHKDPIKPSVEAIEDLQRSIDYWAERCLKAEHEIERLRRDLTHYPALELSFHAANKLIEQHEDEIDRLRVEIRALERGEGRMEGTPPDKSSGIALAASLGEIERLRKAGYGGLHYDLAEKQRQEIERLRADINALNRELDLLEEKSRYE